MLVRIDNLVRSWWNAYRIQTRKPSEDLEPRNYSKKFHGHAMLPRVEMCGNQVQCHQMMPEEARLHQEEKTQVGHKASTLLCFQPSGSHFDPMTTTLGT